MICTHMEYYAAIKKNKNDLYEQVWYIFKEIKCRVF